MTRPRWPAFFLAALGPGVIGLVADNDAGGMLAYLLTGAGHGLVWVLPALVLLGIPTLFIARLALRVTQATGLPYSKVLLRAVGRPLTLIEAVALGALNVLMLLTEFLGMTLALSLAGIPVEVALPVTLGLVIALTSSRVYPRIEDLLLRTAVVSLAFIPALLLAHPAPGALAAAWAGPASSPWFILLVLAGNSIAPWMIYWQQNAAWAGLPRTARQQAWDLATGVVAMIVMAGAVVLLGALTPGDPSRATSPLAWLQRNAGQLPAALFAVGIFGAGLLSACTISLSSLWTLREALGAGARHQSEAPNRGPWLAVHVATLAAAAAVIMVPQLAAGALVLWTQALAAVWMPVSLALLAMVVRSRRVMGRYAVTRLTQALLWATAAGFAAIAYLGLAGALGG